MEKTELVPMTEAQEIVSGINTAENEFFASFEAETMEQKKLLYNASTAGDPIKDVKNRTLDLVDVVVIPVQVKNEDGSTNDVPRITLICKDGKMYTATSWGVYNGLKRIQAIFGTLHFPEGLKITPVDVKTKSGSTINLQLV